MAQPKKPTVTLAQHTTYGTLLAGHDMPLGIAALKAVTTVCPPGRIGPAEPRTGWPKGPTTRH